MTANVDARRRCGYAAVALIGDEAHRSRLGDGEVDARDAHVCSEEHVAQVAAGDRVELRGLIRVVRTELGSEEVSDLGAGAMQHGSDDVRRRVTGELHDELAEVGLCDFDARDAERVVQLDLLGDHRFGLHGSAHAAVSCERCNVGVGLGRVCGPVDRPAGMLDGVCELPEVAVEVGEDVDPYRPGTVPHRFHRRELGRSREPEVREATSADIECDDSPGGAVATCPAEEVDGSRHG